ncbi:MAG: winged helix DNA-binding domain-containing protein, partial [Solirubrobacteraceae bacterium]
RLTAQLLAGSPARDPLAVAQRLLAIQGQDPRGARLAIRAHTSGVTAADVDRELTEQRSLLITWCNRGTLHLISSEDYPWLQALTTPPLITQSTRRLSQEGLDPTMTRRALAVVQRCVGEEGPLTRVQLRDRLQRADVPVAGQALIQILFRAAVEGLVVRGPIVGNQHAYVLVHDWLGPTGRAGSGRAGSVCRETALAELARRYLAGHGPAGDRDLARWAGLPLRDARAGLSAIAGELREGQDDGRVDLRGRPRMAALPPPRLLGPWEPLLVGWASRAHVLAGGDTRVVSGGLFRSFALVHGRGVATWRLDGGGGVTIDPFAPLSDDDARALQRDGEALLRFLGAAAQSGPATPSRDSGHVT